jgi:hypothetical protein
LWQKGHIPFHLGPYLFNLSSRNEGFHEPFQLKAHLFGGTPIGNNKPHWCKQDVICHKNSTNQKCVNTRKTQEIGRNSNHPRLKKKIKFLSLFSFGTIHPKFWLWFSILMKPKVLFLNFFIDNFNVNLYIIWFSHMYLI